MWIMPKNYQPSSVFAADMLASKEDLILPGLNIESSLMWRSKPSPLRTWSLRWKRESWLRHLFGRILKPSQRTYFEGQLILSLAAIRANRSARQVSEQEQTTRDTCGHSFDNTSKQLDLLAVFSRTSKAIFRLDSPASLVTWKKIVTEQRGEYLARVKLAHITKESESISWPTVTTQDNIQIKGKDKRGTTLGGAVRQWPTVTTQDSDKATKKMRDNHQNNLTAVVFSREKFPTPTARDAKGGYNQMSLQRKDGKSRRFDGLPNAAIGGVGTDIVPGHLNPDWVEWLMGVPTGWTELGSWGTE